MTSQTHISGCVISGKGGAALGIDVHSARGAPAGEYCRVDYCPDDAVSSGAVLAFLCQGLFMPRGKIGRQYRVCHDAERGVVTVRLKPADADGYGLGGDVPDA